MKRISDVLWELPREGAMRVPARIYASDSLMEDLAGDRTMMQVRNVATLPGIVGYSLAMPDAHMGYGFSIGGVAAMDAKEGVVSPGGVGYDINCGVRLLRTGLHSEDLKGKIDSLVRELYNRIPTGVGSSGAIRKLGRGDLIHVLTHGARWAVDNGYGSASDLEYIEERGALPGADPDTISSRAIERGQPQLGTLGSGNHFLEISAVEEVFDREAAAAYGLEEGQVTLLVHTGSRGLGYQVCDDYLKVLGKATARYDINLPDRQLACVPITSPEGRRYLSAMASAANYAWANRQILSSLACDAMGRALGMGPATLKAGLVYDIAHNIVKFENHTVEGRSRRLAVHRKGATRAFGPGRAEVPVRYREVGQPVLLPGDMGTASYVLAGTERAMEETFGSSAHGAGRLLSRSRAKRTGRGRDIRGELKGRGVTVLASGKTTLLEEMPDAYKDVSEVARVTEEAGISRRVVRLKPMGVVKG